MQVDGGGEADTVIGYLNDAKLTTSSAKAKAELLKQGSEVLRRAPHLVKEFLPQFLEFQVDKGAPVRKFVVSFARDVTKRDVTGFPQALGCYAVLARDEAPTVAVHALLAASQATQPALHAAIRETRKQEWQRSVVAGIEGVCAAAAEVLAPPARGAPPPSGPVHKRHVSAVRVLKSAVFALSLLPHKRSRDPLLRAYATPLQEVEQGHPVLDLEALEGIAKDAVDALCQFLAYACRDASRGSVSLRAGAVTAMNALFLVAFYRPQFAALVANTMIAVAQNAGPGGAALSGSLGVMFRSALARLLKSSLLPDSVRPRISTSARTIGLSSGTKRGRRAPPRGAPAKRPRPGAPVDPRDAAGPTAAPVDPRDARSKTAPARPVGLAAPAPAAAPVPPALASLLEDIDDIPIAEVVHMVLQNMSNLPPPPVGTGKEKRGSLHSLLLAVYDGGQADGPAKATEQNPAAPVEGSALSSVRLKPLAPERSAALSHMLFARLLAAEKGADATGFQTFREATVARLACCPGVQMLNSAVPLLESRAAAQEGEVRRKRVADVVSYVLSDYRKRHSLALALLYQQYTLEELQIVVEGDEADAAGEASGDKDVDMKAGNAGAEGQAGGGGGDADTGDSAGSKDGDEAKGDDGTSLAEVSLAEPETLTEYDSLFSTILSGLKTALGPSDKLFRQLVCEAPRVTIPALRVVADFCLDPDRFMLGLQTLRDVVINRPRVRTLGLCVALQFTTCRVNRTRQKAIQLVANVLFRQEHLKARIRQWATAALDSIRLATVLDGAKTEAELAAEDEEITVADVLDVDVTENAPEDGLDIQRRLQLHIALCTKEIGLLKEIVRVYPDSCAAAQTIMLETITKLVQTLAYRNVDPVSVTSQMFGCVEKAVPLVVKVVSVLVETIGPGAQHSLLPEVSKLHAQTAPGTSRRVFEEDDVRLFLPVLGALPKSKVMEFLPSLVKLPLATVRPAFHLIASASTTSRLPLTSWELMAEVLSLEFAGVPVKTLFGVMQLFYDERPSERALYTAKMHALALQNLVDRTDQELPTLLLAAMVRSVGRYARLKEFIVGLLSKLLLRKVWEHEQLLVGFVLCCKNTAPESLAVMCRLPIAVLRTQLESPKNGALKRRLEMWAPSHTHLISKDVQGLLGVGAPEPPPLPPGPPPDTSAAQPTPSATAGAHGSLPPAPAPAPAPASASTQRRERRSSPPRPDTAGSGSAGDGRRRSRSPLRRRSRSGSPRGRRRHGEGDRSGDRRARRNRSTSRSPRSRRR